MYFKIIKHLGAKLLPKSFFYRVNLLINQRNKHKYKQIPKLSENGFRAILQTELGICKGLVVFIHSSIDKMNLDFPFYKVYFILKEIVGKEGTLLFPCSHLTGRAEECLNNGIIFDINKSFTMDGIIPEFVRLQRGAFRSLHPTNSVVAIGKYAQELTETHSMSLYPCDDESPYYKIVKYDGIIIGLGVSTENMSFVHCIEDIWKEKFPVETRKKEIFRGRVVDAGGSELFIETLVAAKRIRWRNVNKYISRFVSPEVCRDININGINFFRAGSRKLYLRMEELAARNITIYSKLVYKKFI